jgi:hypothetical protein
MVASRQHLLLLKNKTANTQAKQGVLNGLVVYIDVRIGLTLYHFSDELNSFFGGNKKKCPLNKISASVLAKTPRKGAFRGN